jgi:hypothetical protein
MIKYSICVPTVNGREYKFQKLIDNLQDQIENGKYEKYVEIIICKDNKEISIGAKRDKMIMESSGVFCVMIDDDDNVVGDYIQTLIENYDSKVDTIGYIEECRNNGFNPKFSKISTTCNKWREVSVPIGKFSNFRTPYFKNPIKTKIMKRVGCEDMRWGEDHDFSDRILPYLKKEKFIDKVMYLYNYISEDHNKKYGII